MTEQTRLGEMEINEEKEVREMLEADKQMRERQEDG